MRRRILVSLLTLAVVAAMITTGCSGNQGGTNQGQETTTKSGSVGTVGVVGVWGGEELKNFRQVAQGWEQESGGNMQFEGTRDLSAILRARVQGGNPPDIAILPNPALIDTFKDQLKPLDPMVDMNQVKQDYASTWLEQGSADGKLLGLVVKAAPKSTVWYSPPDFQKAGYDTPKSWDELMSLTKQIRDKGDVAPWSIGLEQGGASGWPGSDWIQEIYLAENGPDKYDQWTSHQIKWTDPTVKAAWQKFGEVANTKGNVTGGADKIVSTDPEAASYLPFQDPPQARMYFLGAFTQGFISAQFPNLKPVQDYDFFDFPTIDTALKSPTTVGGDTIVVFNDNASTRSFVRYMAQGKSWTPWVQAGGFTTPNKSVTASSYPDPLAQKAAQQLTESDPIRFDADDLMPAELQQAYFKGIIEYVQNPDRLDSILSNLESVATDAYGNKQ